MTRGLFISIEGNEGVGKSTLARRLGIELTNLGHSVVVTREPGGTPSADLIRAMFANPAPQDDFFATTEALLLSAARAQHVGRLIPVLERGDWVITDRYHDSMRVYQGALGGLDRGVLETLIQIATSGLEPDLTVLLDCDVGVARARLAGRRDPDSIKRFDDAEVRTHQQIRTAFLVLRDRFPDRIVMVDADQEPESLVKNVLTVLASRGLLNGSRPLA